MSSDTFAVELYLFSALMSLTTRYSHALLEPYLSPTYPPLRPKLINFLACCFSFPTLLSLTAIPFKLDIYLGYMLLVATFCTCAVTDINIIFVGFFSLKTVSQRWQRAFEDKSS